MTEKGPAYQLQTTDRLIGRVVTPGSDPNLHGFDLERDLAKSFRFGEVVLLALTGEEPDPVRGRAFEAAMTFASAISVAEAPAHAAVLARICGSPAAPLVGSAAITAAERARAIVEAHRDLLQSRQSTVDGTDEGVEGTDRSHVHLAEAIGEGAPAFLAKPMSRTAAILSVLIWCGLTTEESLIAALTIAALPASIAEGLAARPLAFGDYPLRLPEFEYAEP
jgi:hypothetical protein